ncbi:MaoC family dehydratase [Rhizobium sp. KVB221]|uniref:MaoC family dehydratase n=1 Tax=Rhizobium setariae TaxID=2801340 RepID=A0A936YKM6_9HYPH|nr:MaoC family dehydratase [Rhizobium setariae]MBL0371998.1 MaoC family dehydratase [Rhizobium setariae]
MKLRDAMKPGEPVTIGSYTFTSESIVEFAQEFDPHFFHVDAEMAKSSLFGGLCASGWHVCSAAMKCNVANIFEQSAKIAAAGGEPPKLGPSPGVRNLKWLKPVFAGDTVTYAMTFNHDRAVPNRPGRNICDLTYEGVNQRGETVMRFDCTVVEFD